MSEKYIERAAYGSSAASNVDVTAAALGTVAAAVASAATVAAATVAGAAVATTFPVVVVDGALAAAPNEVNGDAAGIAIATKIIARVTPSSKPH